MRTNIYFLLLFLSSLAYSNENAQNQVPITGRVEEAELMKNAHQRKEDPQSRTYKIADIPKIKEIVQKCQSKALEILKKEGKAQPTQADYEEAKEECIREAFEKIPGTEAKKILDGFTGSKGVVETQTQSNMRYESNPAYKKLNEFLSKRFRDSLIAEEKMPDGTVKKKFLDHIEFYNFYNTQLGKNVIASVSSYCVYADQNGIVSADPEKRKTQREENLLKIAETVKLPPDKNQKGKDPNQGMPTNMAYMQFSQCLSMLTHICGRGRYQQGSVVFDFADEKEKDLHKQLGGENVYGPFETFQRDIDYSQMVSCIVSNELKRTKKLILEMEELKKKIAKVQNETNGDGFNLGDDKNFKGMYRRGEGEGEKTANELTSLTSHEFAESGADDELKRQLITFQKQCLKNPESKQCKEMLNNNKDLEKFYQLRSDNAAITELKAKAIEGMTPDELKKFLAQEGRRQQEIKMILQEAAKKPGGINDLKKKIAERYRKEQNAVREALARQLEDHNVEFGQTSKANTQGKLQKGNVTPDKKKALMERAFQKLRTGRNETRDTLVYMNIMLGLLTVRGEKGKVSTNPQVAWNELQDSHIDPGKNKFVGGPGEEDSLIDKQAFRRIQKGATQSLRKEKKGARDTSELSVGADEINQFLGNYLDDVGETQKKFRDAHRKRNQQANAGEPAAPENTEEEKNGNESDPEDDARDPQSSQGLQNPSSEGLKGPSGSGLNGT